jgi:hypothetical protein
MSQMSDAQASGRPFGATGTEIVSGPGGAPPAKATAALGWPPYSADDDTSVAACCDAPRATSIAVPASSGSSGR